MDWVFGQVERISGLGLVKRISGPENLKQTSGMVQVEKISELEHLVRPFGLGQIFV